MQRAHLFLPRFYALQLVFFADAQKITPIKQMMKAEAAKKHLLLCAICVNNELRIVASRQVQQTLKLRSSNHVP